MDPGTQYVLISYQPLSLLLNPSPSKLLAPCGAASGCCLCPRTWHRVGTQNQVTLLQSSSSFPQLHGVLAAWLPAGAPLGTAFGPGSCLTRGYTAPGCSLHPASGTQWCKGLAPSLSQGNLQGLCCSRTLVDWLSPLLRLHHNPTSLSDQSCILHHLQVLIPRALLNKRPAHDSLSEKLFLGECDLRQWVS